MPFRFGDAPWIFYDFYSVVFWMTKIALGTIEKKKMKKMLGSVHWQYSSASKVNINYGEIEKFRAVVVLRFLESESYDGDDVEEDQRNFICNSIPFHLIYTPYTCDSKWHTKAVLRWLARLWQTNRLCGTHSLALQREQSNWWLGKWNARDSKTFATFG